MEIDELFEFVLWNKLDQRNTFIASGDRIMQGYEKRAQVTVNDKGSTLTIAVAGENDAGMYKCSLRIQDLSKEVVHKVIIRGE